jgi:hypothetical protein
MRMTISLKVDTGPQVDPIPLSEVEKVDMELPPLVPELAWAQEHTLQAVLPTPMRIRHKDTIPLGLLPNNTRTKLVQREMLNNVKQLWSDRGTG